MDIIEKVRAYSCEHSLFYRGDTVLIACSGGPDSLALLDIMATLAPEEKLTLAVCYVHHGIRKAADEEVTKVRREAEARNCQFIGRYADIPALAKEQHRSLEAVGRDERYRLLREEAARIGAHAIAVAHHQNDQAETVLIHVLRGSGISGLMGMMPKNKDIIRPLLGLTRYEIDEYIKENRLSPCHDETNDEAIYTRNRIRLELLPYLKEYNPAIVEDLNRLAQIAQAEELFLLEETQKRYDRLVHIQDGGLGIDKKCLLAQPEAMQRRLIRRMLQHLCGTTQNISFHYVETVRALASKGAGKKFQTGIWLAYTTKRDVCVIPAVYRRR